MICEHEEPWIAMALQELQVPYDAHVVNVGGVLACDRALGRYGML